MESKTYTDEEIREAMQLAEMLYPAAPPKGKKALSVLEWAAGEWLRMKDKRPECYSSTCGYIEPKS